MISMIALLYLEDITDNELFGNRNEYIDVCLCLIINKHQQLTESFFFYSLKNGKHIHGFFI